METLVLAPNSEGIARAAALLRAGRLVAFPTETVYGLGANALDAGAVAGIFRAKGRPSDDPLIVHLPNAGALGRVARTVPAAAQQLAERFWPGPLTLVLPKVAEIPGEVTAGLDTVGVRVPSHPVAHALLEATGLPLAAPSANLFTRPSPTRPAHVLEDLGGRIDAVLDGGPTDVGVESTIVDLSVPERPRLLRPGGVPTEALEAVLGVSLLPPPRATEHGPQVAPGLLEVHYAPRTPLHLVPGADGVALAARVQDAIAAGKRAGVLLLDEDAPLMPSGAVVQRLGPGADPAAVATRLFDALRTLDRSNLDVLYARLPDGAVSSGGLWRALADRLRRAATRSAD